MSKNKEKLLKPHPIQLLKVNVIELSIRSNQSPDESIGIDDTMDIPLLVGHSEFNNENRQIAVVVKVETKVNKGEKKDAEDSFFLRVELVGEFKVEENFPMEHIDSWARDNAPFILMPYLREHVYSLTLRCGLKPIVLPLLQVPTLRHQ
jgi:preprotein translocase subunit SecB